MSESEQTRAADDGDDLLRRAGRLFDELTDLDLEARRALLDERCAGDPELRREVESLLGLFGEVRTFLESPAAGAWIRTPEPHAAIEEGGQVGPYRLLERLGEGGFGVVYLAEQRQDVRRRVALKLVKLGMDSRDVVARFEAERQALALLDHPGIAHVYDAGTAASGRPYFVMEYVSGDPLVTYCDRRRLDVAARIRLMVRVCEAVQHAHQKGILHRDLKPSNVLVTELDQRAEPKIIDFGIAKAMHERLTDKTLFTERGQLVGTPGYMSPEQADQNTLDLDTRTDVYSLGVMLYELLVGAPPFDPKLFATGGLAEVQRVIREVDPPRPSSRLLKSDELNTIAELRQRDGRSLLRSVRGDLDWIVMKALEKDRARRYGSAAELARDLGRYLEHLPVAAGPPSRWYLLRKFARRHRMFAAASAAIVLLLLGGAAVTSLALIRERSARADAVRDAAKAQSVNDFLREMLASPGAAQVPRRDVPVREVLDSAANTVRESFASQPDVEAPLQLTIGATYRVLGELEKAGDHLHRAAELRRAAAPRSLDMADVCLEIGLLDRETSRFPEAEAALNDALAQYREFAGEHSEPVALTLNALGDLCKDDGRFAEAEARYREALDLVRRHLPDSALQSVLLIDLGRLLEHLSRYDDSERVLREALAIETARGSTPVARLLRIQDGLAQVSLHRGDLAGAEAEFRHSLEIASKHFGDDHIETAVRQDALAEILQQQDKLDEALSLFRKAVATLRARYPDGSPNLSKSLTNLAWVLNRKAKLEESEQLLREALEMGRRLLGPRHPDVGHVLNDLGLLLYGKKQYADAEAALGEAASIFEEAFGEHHLWTAIATKGLADSIMDRGDLEAALPLLERACNTIDEVLPPENWQCAEFHKRHAACLMKLGRHDEAQEELESAYETMAKQFGPDHRRATNLAKQLVELFVETDRYDEAALWRERLPASMRDYGVAEEQKRRAGKP